MAYKEPYTTSDGFSAMTKGMHSGLDPLLLDSNGQYAYAVNCSTRGGYIHTRPGFTNLGTLGSGKFQGAGVYALDEADHMAFAISGKVYVRNGTTGAITEITGHTLSITTTQVYFTQVYRWMVVQDGVSRPIVIQESGGLFSRVARDAVLDGPPPTDAEQAPWVALPIGTIGAYAHGRYHFVPKLAPESLPELELSDDESYYTNADDVPVDSAESGRACFISSDVLDVLQPAAVFRMTEHRSLDEGGCYGLPAELGFIHGMGAMRGASTGTGIGSLYVFGSRGVSAFEVSSPRSSIGTEKSWKDIAFSQVAFYGAGTYSPSSIVNVNDDIWYVDANKYLRSIYYDSTQLGSAGYAGAAQFNTTKSFETERWVQLTTNEYRPYISAATAKNRLHWVLCDGSGVCSLDFAQAYTAIPTEIPPLHEGMWTGFDFKQVLSLCDSLHAIVAQDEDVYLLRADESLHSDPNDTSIESFIVTKMYSGQYNEMYWLHRTKNLSYVELLIAGITRPTTLEVYFRPIHYPTWTLLGSQEFNVPDGSPAQVRARVKFAVNPATMSNCNSVTKEALYSGHAFQFMIKWTGRLQINRFTVAAPVVEEAPRAQCQTDNANLIQYPEEEFHDFDYVCEIA